MKYYKLSIIKNFKRGFLTIPFGFLTIGLIYIILGLEIDFWQKMLLTTILGSIGLPGILIHIYYLWHDRNKRISNNPKNDFFDFETNGSTVKILRADIETIEKIHRDIRFVPWWSYMMFKIGLKSGKIYSITNLSIEFDELYDILKAKDRQINIFNKFKLI